MEKGEFRLKTIKILKDNTLDEFIDPCTEESKFYMEEKQIPSIAVDIADLYFADVIPSNNLYECNGWKIYTPQDDECVVVIEDPFNHKRTIDVSDFEKLMEVLHCVNDY